MDNQRMREIVQQAQADAIAALKGYFDGQYLSQEDKEMIFDTLEAGVPFYPEKLNLATEEEIKYYDRCYLRTIHNLGPGILNQGQTVDETVEKYINYQEAEIKASRDLGPFLSEHISKGESLSSILASLQFPDNTENERLYATIFTSLLTRQLTMAMDGIATTAAETDIKNKNTASYDLNVQKESGDLLKTFKDKYGKVTKARAEQLAIEDAKKAAKEDYEAGNKDHKEPQLLDSMSDVYRSAYIDKYSTAYKLAFNKLKRNTSSADADLDDELEQLRQLQEQNEKKGETNSKLAKVKSATHKLKVNKFGVKFLSKVGKWRQKQLNDVEDVIEEFGSVRAIHNPYRENYYSKDERERCEKILIAYERLQEFLGISPARNRDGSKPYMSIKDASVLPGLTKDQKQALQALEGKVTKAYHTLAHSAKDSTELDAVVKEADELLDKFLVREGQIIIPSIVGKVTEFLKEGEKFGYLSALYIMPNLKDTYDKLMDQKPLTRANYTTALDLTEKMEKFYEQERKLAKSFMAHKEAKKNSEKKEEKKTTSNSIPKQKLATEEKTASTPTPVEQLNQKSKPKEPGLTHAELIRQLHEARQETIQLKEKNKELKETLQKRSKSLKSAKNDKRRLKTKNAQLTQSIELLTKNVKELSRQMQQMTSDLNTLRDAVAKEESQKEQYKQMVDEMRKAMKHQPSVELNSDEKEVEELVSYMDRIDKKRFFENEASHEVLNDLYMLKAKGTLHPEYTEKLNKVIRQIEEGRNITKDQQELDIPFQKHL